MPAPRLLRLVAALAAAAPASAQFVNRAVWLGHDEEPVRATFTRSPDYFLDRASYVVLPPWWERDQPWAVDRATYALGSVSSTKFTIEGRIDHALELGDGATFRQHLLQSENRDTRFLRDALALEYDVGVAGDLAVFAQGELFADKSLIDASLGAWLLRDAARDTGLRVMATAVDWTHEKSFVVDYYRAPYALLAAGAFGGPTGHRVVFEFGVQLPLESVELATGERHELWRGIVTAETRLRLGSHDVLVLAGEAERTGKELRPLDPADPLREDFVRTFWQVRAEWWRDTELPWSAGLLHTGLDEDGDRPNDPAAQLRGHRREWLALARAHVPVAGKLALEPHVFAGVVDEDWRDETAAFDRTRFEGKLGGFARWTFSPLASLAVSASVQLDEPKFGGGGAQFVARF